MERDILNQLYYGEIVPWENRNDKTPEMEPLSDQVDADIEALEQLLDDAGKQILTVPSWNGRWSARVSRTDSDWVCSLPPQGFPAKKSRNLHNFPHGYLCNIYLRNDWLLSSFRANICTTERENNTQNGGKHNERKAGKTG